MADILIQALGDHLLVHTIVHRHLVVVRKFARREFADGIGVQSVKKDNKVVAGIRIGTGSAFSLVFYTAAVIFLDRKVFVGNLGDRGVGDIRNMAVIVVCADIPDAADTFAHRRGFFSIPGIGRSSVNPVLVNGRRAAAFLCPAYQLVGAGYHMGAPLTGSGLI